LHPIVPFVTEEIWQRLPRGAEDGRTITLAAFPAAVPAWRDEEAVAEVEALQEIVTTIRTVRSERNVPPSRKIAAIIDEWDPARRAALARDAGHIRMLAGLERLEFRGQVEMDPDTVKRVLTHTQIYVPLAGIVDRRDEVERLQKELAGLVRDVDATERRLANASFVEKAPPNVVEDARGRLEQLKARRAKLEATLVELGA
jgi:valyl-tRNA synthetase